MTEKFKKIIEILNNSDISEQEKDNFLNILLFVPDEDFDELSQTIEQNPKLIREVLDNYKLKKEALENQDKDKWDKALQQEEELES